MHSVSAWCAGPPDRPPKRRLGSSELIASSSVGGREEGASSIGAERRCECFCCFRSECDRVMMSIATERLLEVGRWTQGIKCLATLAWSLARKQAAQV